MFGWRADRVRAQRSFVPDSRGGVFRAGAEIRLQTSPERPRLPSQVVQNDIQSAFPGVELTVCTQSELVLELSLQARDGFEQNHIRGDRRSGGQVEKEAQTASGSVCHFAHKNADGQGFLEDIAH